MTLHRLEKILEKSWKGLEKNSNTIEWEKRDSHARFIVGHARNKGGKTDKKRGGGGGGGD